MNIAVGGYAMSKSGLTPFYPGTVLQTTEVPELDGWVIGGNKLYYLPRLSSFLDNIVSTVPTVISRIGIPTPERAIMDYIQNLDCFGVDFLYDGIEEYGRQNRYDWSKLEQLAREYGLLDELHFHIDEAYATSSDGE